MPDAKIVREMQVKNDDLQRQIIKSKRVRTIKLVEVPVVVEGIEQVQVTVEIKGSVSAFRGLQSKGLIAEDGSEDYPKLDLELRLSDQSTLDKQP